MTQTLIDRVTAELNAARVARTDTVAISLLNTLRGEALKVGKDAGNRAPTDAETLAVIKKFVKNGEQTVADLARFGRDTADQERELAILRGYLPVGMSEDELRKIVRDVVAANPDKAEQLKAKPGNVGWFVGQVMKASGGKADPKAVGDLVKADLGL